MRIEHTGNRGGGKEDDEPAGVTPLAAAAERQSNERDY